MPRIGILQWSTRLRVLRSEAEDDRRAAREEAAAEHPAGAAPQQIEYVGSWPRVGD